MNELHKKQILGGRQMLQLGKKQVKFFRQVKQIFAAICKKQGSSAHKWI